MSAGYCQDPGLRRAVVPNSPRIGKRQVIINQVTVAPTKATVDISDRDVVSALTDSLPNTGHGLSRAR